MGVRGGRIGAIGAIVLFHHQSNVSLFHPPLAVVEKSIRVIFTSP